MPRTIERTAPLTSALNQVFPSLVDPATAEPFTLEQELKPFGAWAGKPIWVPPKDETNVLAESMLQETRPFAGREQRWAAIEKKHRADFTQVREFDLFEASIRLPKGRFFVTVTEQKDFDKITDTIPACVQTRLDEFLSGPANKPGTKVYYLKPLCVEVGDELVLTTGEDLNAAVATVQDEVFAQYRKLALYRRPLQAAVAAANFGLALPRGVMNYVVSRRKKAIDAMQARLDFQRRKLALRAAKTYGKCRTDACTFNDMLELTSAPKRTDVIEQYCTENEVSKAQRRQLLAMAAGTVPWFVSLALVGYHVATLALMLSTPPIVVCDPAFVVELPGSNGVLLKIGHFDEVGGVMHVEI